MKLVAFVFFYTISTVIYYTANAQGMPASCPESAKYYSKDSINVITFGASTVEGVNGTDFQSYLTRNFVNCYVNKEVRVEKFGVGGETTGKSLLRLNAAIATKTGFIVILVGVNDAVSIEAGRQSIGATESNMRLIITRSLNQKLVPILCTLQYFDDRDDKRLTRINAKIDEINSMYKMLAKEYGIYLADLNRFFKRDFSLYQDIIHPNARGNRLIGFVVFDTINKIIAQRFLQFSVSQNYPNPTANNSTSIDIVMPEPDKIEIQVFSMQGKILYSAVNEYLNTGRHVVKLDLSLVAPGLYIYKIRSYSGLYTATKKMIVGPR